MWRRIVKVALLASCTLASASAAQERPMPLRSLDRFELDTEVARGVWAELPTFYTLLEQDFGRSFYTVTLEPRLVYGGGMLEGGLAVPYHWLNGAVSPSEVGTSKESGLGDVHFYGKAMPLDTEWFDAGLGLDVSLPSGDEDKGLGAGETGFMPYGMMALQLGAGQLRAHFGYRAYTGSQTDVRGNGFPPNSYLYGAGLFGPFGKNVALRVEIAGQSFDTAGNPDVVFFEPGIDVRIPLDGFDVLVRPTGAVGLTDESPDWGIGGSFVVAWNPGGQDGASPE